MHNADPQAPYGRNLTSKILSRGKAYVTAAANRIPQPAMDNNRRQMKHPKNA
jgi:hypothetical protein